LCRNAELARFAASGNTEDAIELAMESRTASNYLVITCRDENNGKEEGEEVAELGPTSSTSTRGLTRAADRFQFPPQYGYR
jgi:hypothetical protein